MVDTILCNRNGHAGHGARRRGERTHGNQAPSNMLKRQMANGSEADLVEDGPTVCGTAQPKEIVNHANHCCTSFLISGGSCASLARATAHVNKQFWQIEFRACYAL